MPVVAMINTMALFLLAVRSSPVNTLIKLRISSSEYIVGSFFAALLYGLVQNNRLRAGRMKRDSAEMI
jgi:hypothetical protein